MAGSLNKVTLIGHLGKDPEIRSTQTGSRLANISLATTESWRDKNTGEKRDKTEWHRVVIFSEGLVKVCEQYIKKGSKIYLEGQLETRKWTDQAGQEKYTTEIVLRPFTSTLIMLDGRGDHGGAYKNVADQGQGFNSFAGQDQNAAAQFTPQNAPGAPQQAMHDELDDEVPF